jgi:hypothetical protein
MSRIFLGPVGSMSSRKSLRLAALLCIASGVACDQSTAPVGPSIAKSISIVSGAEQSGVVNTELPKPLIVKAVDEAGKPVLGQIVNFVVTSGGGHVFAGAAATDKNGTAQEFWTLGKTTADPQIVEVRSVDPTTGEKKVYGEFRATPLAGPALPPDTLRFASIEDCVAPSGAVTHPYLRMLDQYGNPAAGGQAQFSITGGGSLQSSQVTSGNDGNAVAAWTFGPAGKQSISATSFGKSFVPNIQSLFRVPDCWAYPTAGRTLRDATNRNVSIQPPGPNGLYQFDVAVIANGIGDQANRYAGHVANIAGGLRILSVSSESFGRVVINTILGPIPGTLNSVDLTVPGIGSITLQLTTSTP